jgi:nucleotide-binding universal stress UspA family protein
MPVQKASVRLSFENILFPTDFTVASDTALPFALAFARWYGARIIVAHAVPPPVPLTIPLEPVPVEMDAQWQEAQGLVDRLAHSECLQGTRNAVILEQGRVWSVLSDAIRKHSVDLIVLGTHGRQGLKKLVLGSSAEEIFRHAACPVLTIGPKVRAVPADFRLKHILFATDFSTGSLHALAYALSLAEENQAELTLLHSIPLVPLHHQETVREGAIRRLQSLIPSDAADWCDPQSVVRFELPVEAVLRQAEEEHADLIVMGVRQHAHVAAHLPWATAYEVVCRAACPVLTVRD